MSVLKYSLNSFSNKYKIIERDLNVFRLKIKHRFLFHSFSRLFIMSFTILISGILYNLFSEKIPNSGIYLMLVILFYVFALYLYSKRSPDSISVLKGHLVVSRSGIFSKSLLDIDSSEITEFTIKINKRLTGYKGRLVALTNHSEVPVLSISGFSMEKLKTQLESLKSEFVNIIK